MSHDPWAQDWDRERAVIVVFFEDAQLFGDERAFWDDLWYGLRDMYDGLFEEVWQNDPERWFQDYQAWGFQDD